MVTRYAAAFCLHIFPRAISGSPSLPSSSSSSSSLPDPLSRLRPSLGWADVTSAGRRPDRSCSSFAAPALSVHQRVDIIAFECLNKTC